MVKGIFGIGRTLTIRREPFIKKSLAVRSSAELRSQAVSETLVRASGIFNNMTINKEQVDREQISTGKKIRTIRGVVVSAVKETRDTWTLHIFVGDNDKDYHAGQFISIPPQQFIEMADMVKYFEYEKGKKEPVRAYSLTSAPHEKYVSITIKPEIYEPYPGSFPPLLSPILASDILVGREIEFTGYAGGYVVPEELDPAISHVVHLVAGSGMVPSYSILKDQLFNKKNPWTKHTVLYVNKTLNDVIFYKELCALEETFPDRLSIKHFLSQEKTHTSLGPNYFYCRPNIEHVYQMMPNPQNTLFFACGPAVTKWQKRHAQETGAEIKPRFMEWVHDVMETLNIDKKRIKREVYG